MNVIKYRVLLAALIMSFSVCSSAQAIAFKEIKAAKQAKLNGIPWGMTFVSADQLIVTIGKHY